MDYEYNVQMHLNQTFRQNGVLFGYQFTQFCLLSFYVYMFYIFTIIFYKKFIQHTIIQDIRNWEFSTRLFDQI